MNPRTDLACEKYSQSKGEDILRETESPYGITIEKITVSPKEDSGTPEKHLTLSFKNLSSFLDTSSIRDTVIFAIGQLLPRVPDSVLVIGLGNRDITPDALGPLAANRILVTRHIDIDTLRTLGFGELCQVSAITPSVLGKTGIEAVEIIKGAVAHTKPDAVIVIDALAAADTERLCRTVQLSNNGIAPGSGVKNSRKEISSRTLNIPVIAVGVPTVTEMSLLEKEKNSAETLLVTPTEIDSLIKSFSEILSDALNLFLHPSLDIKTLKSLV